MTRINYRDASLDDAEILSALGKHTFIETFGPLYSAADLDSYLTKSFGPGVQTHELQQPDIAYRLAWCGNEPIGFAMMSPMGLPFGTENRQTIELKRLYVRSDYHGAGVAQRLMAWCLATCMAAGADDVYLSVFNGNQRGQRFYLRHGFRIVASYHFMVGQQADEEYIMRARLVE